MKKKENKEDKGLKVNQDALKQLIQVANTTPGLEGGIFLNNTGQPLIIVGK